MNLFWAILFTGLGYWAGAKPEQLKELYVWIKSKLFNR